MILFHQALWVTLMSFGAVSVRYLPVRKSLGQRVGDALRATWYVIFLIGIGGFLIYEMRNFPDPAKRLPGSFRVSLPYWVNVPAHIAVWLCYLLTAFHIYQFRAFRRIAEEVVDFTFDILLLPVSFGLLSLHCIRILPAGDGRELWSATATLDAAEMWESWALWSFQTLFIRYVEGSDEAEERLFSHFKQICLIGVQQYVVFNFATNVVEFIWREVDRYDPELCGKMWGWNSTCEEEFYLVEDYLIGALWYSCSIAIYSILRFEQAMARSLHPIGPFWKFWGAKLIVSVAGVQRLVLLALTKVGVTAEVFAWYIHAYLLCFETFGLSVLHFWAYPASGYFKMGDRRQRKDLQRRSRAEGEMQPAILGKSNLDMDDDEEQHLHVAADALFSVPDRRTSAVTVADEKEEPISEQRGDHS